MKMMRFTGYKGQHAPGRLEARKEARFMSTLKRAKAAIVLAALLSMVCAGPSALAAPETPGTAQQAAVSIVALRHASEGAQTRIILEGTAELPYSIYGPDERTLLIDLPNVDATKLND